MAGFAPCAGGRVRRRRGRPPLARPAAAWGGVAVRLVRGDVRAGRRDRRGTEPARAAADGALDRAARGRAVRGRPAPPPTARRDHAARDPGQRAGRGRDAARLAGLRFGVEGDARRCAARRWVLPAGAGRPHRDGPRRREAVGVARCRDRVLRLVAAAGRVDRRVPAGCAGCTGRGRAAAGDDALGDPVRAGATGRVLAGARAAGVDRRLSSATAGPPSPGGVASDHVGAAGLVEIEHLIRAVDRDDGDGVGAGEQPDQVEGP